VYSHLTSVPSSFDGYFDIAIDSSVKTGRRALHGVIDHCFFFDTNAGEPDTFVTQNDKQVKIFTNRGAINISSAVHDGVGNSLFTISHNLFINVWRRQPRVAEGNRAHSFNNLFFRWGFGNDDDQAADGTNEWFCIATDNNAQAVIVANRFIPWIKKKDPRKTISLGPGTAADLGDPHTGTTERPDLTNEFDDENGVAVTVDIPEPGSDPNVIQDINVETWYAELGLVPPPFSKVRIGAFLLDDVGPSGFDFSAETAELRNIIQPTPAPKPVKIAG